MLFTFNLAKIIKTNALLVKRLQWEGNMKNKNANVFIIFTGQAITGVVVIHNLKKFPKLTPENKDLSLLHLLSINSSSVSYL